MSVSNPGKTVVRDGITLNVIDEGQGPAVLLVHGFPDSSLLWRHQVQALTSAGYRVIAPDNRGFGRSDAPVGVEHYTLDEFADDLVAILDACGVDRAAVVGHDWGAGISWALVDKIDKRASCFVTMSVGAPQAYAECDDIRQKEISWYILMLQIEHVAEQMLSAADWKVFRQWARDHAETEHWISDLSREGRLTSMISIYRANVMPMLLSAKQYLSTVPTLGLWSTGDHYLVEEQVIASGRHVQSDWQYEKVQDASHWMMLDRPDHINRLLLNFIGKHPPI